MIPVFIFLMLFTIENVAYAVSAYQDGVRDAEFWLYLAFTLIGLLGMITTFFNIGGSCL